MSVAAARATSNLTIRPAEGGSGRRDAVAKLASSVGGKLEAFYFAFGSDDFYVIVDAPSNDCSPQPGGSRRRDEAFTELPGTWRLNACRPRLDAIDVQASAAVSDIDEWNVDQVLG